MKISRPSLTWLRGASPSKKKLAYAAAGVLLLAGGYALWAPRALPPEARYSFASVERGSVTQTVTANGTLNPVVLVSVGTQVSGTVKKWYADFNDVVKEGQVLMELEDSLYRAQAESSQATVNNAKSSLELAEANARRAQELFAKGYIAQADMDSARQALASARAQYASAAASHKRDTVNLNYTVIRSPVSGVVVSRVVDVGQTVAASFQTPELYKIAQDLSKMQISTTYAEADIGGIKEGMKATFTVDAFPGKRFEGQVSQIRLQATTTSNVVTYNVVVNVDNPDKTLMPGMTAYVNIATASADKVLTVPNAALRFKPAKSDRKSGTGGKPEGERRGTGGMVYVVGPDGEPRGVAIRAGISNGKVTELVAGELKEGDKLITDDSAAQAQDSNASGMRFRMF